MTQSERPLEDSLHVALPSGTLVLFDPDTLDHRRGSPRGWSSDRAELERESSAAHLVALRLPGEVKAASVVLEPGVPDPAEVVVTAKVSIRGKGLFVGDATELPSVAWGKRRWNLWDWAFALFVLTLPPFFVWLLGFDSRLLWVLGGTGAIFLVLLIPFTIAVFRGGAGFAGRSSLPPRDHPERLLKFEPGEYMVALARRGTNGSARERVSVWFARRSG